MESDEVRIAAATSTASIVSAILLGLASGCVYHGTLRTRHASPLSRPSHKSTLSRGIGLGVRLGCSPGQLLRRAAA